MFHNSTTIWHNPTAQPSFYKEGRMTNAILETAQASAMAGLRGVQHVAKFGWNITKPMRWPLKLAVGGVMKGAEYGNKALDHAEWGLRWGKESAKGALWTGAGGSVWEIANGPIDFLKYNLAYNTRDVLQDVFTLKTPMNVLKIPVNAAKGFAEGVSETRKNVGETLKNAVSLRPIKTVKSLGKSISSLAKILPKTAWKPTRAVLDTPIMMGKNIGNSVLAYPKHLYESPKHIRDGAQRIMNAHNVATTELHDPARHHFNRVPGAVGGKLKDWKEKFVEKYNKTAGSAGGGGSAAKAAAKTAAH